MFGVLILSVNMLSISINTIMLSAMAPTQGLSYLKGADFFVKSSKTTFLQTLFFPFFCQQVR
jgi:hypothetical protein